VVCFFRTPAKTKHVLILEEVSLKEARRRCGISSKKLKKLFDKSK